MGQTATQAPSYQPNSDAPSKTVRCTSSSQLLTTHTGTIFAHNPLPQLTNSSNYKGNRPPGMTYAHNLHPPARNRTLSQTHSATLCQTRV